MKEDKRKKIDCKKESKSLYFCEFIRTFIKSLISSRGQATLEYFILFTVIIVLTVLSISTFYQNLQDVGENFFRSCVDLILE